MLDLMPFLVCFTESVYNHLEAKIPAAKTAGEFTALLENGNITEKERNLWIFVLSAYGTEEFSTKQPEKNFCNAVYATTRGFVLKLEGMGLLTGKKYRNRVKYQIQG